MIKLDIQELNQEQLAKLIKYHRINELPRLNKLKGYYGTNHQYINSIISKRAKLDPTKPNHKLISNYPQYIVDIAHNYLVGTPVRYTSSNNKLLDEINLIYDFNYEQDHNSEIAESMGTYGIAYELLYLGKDGQIYFTELPTTETLVIETTAIDPTLACAIHYYETNNILSDDIQYNVEIYWNDRVEYWSGESIDNLFLNTIESHEFGDVPVIVYKNNDELTGDFENVLSLIDDFELRISDMSNELDFFNNSMLIFDGVNLQDIQETDKDGNPIPLSVTLRDMKRNKLLIFPPTEQGESAPSTRIYFVKPDINNDANLNQLNTLIENIHKFSHTPDMSDQNFASNVSGVAMKYKLLSLEQKTKGKERKFKKGLYQRLELITNIMRIKAKNVFANEIQIVFYRSLPIDLSETSTLVSSLKDVVSEDTLLSNIGFVENIEKEKELIKKEKELNKNEKEILE